MSVKTKNKRFFIRINNEKEYKELVIFCISEGILLGTAIKNKIPIDTCWFIFYQNSHFRKGWQIMYSSKEKVSNKDTNEILELVL